MEDNFIDFFNKISSDYCFEKSAFSFWKKKKKPKAWSKIPLVLGGGALATALLAGKFLDSVSARGVYPMYNPQAHQGHPVYGGF